MKAETLSDYVQVRLWLSLLENTVFDSAARYLKSLMKTIRLHRFVVKAPQTQ